MEKLIEKYLGEGFVSDMVDQHGMETIEKEIFAGRKKLAEFKKQISKIKDPEEKADRIEYYNEMIQHIKDWEKELRQLK